MNEITQSTLLQIGMTIHVSSSVGRYEMRPVSGFPRYPGDAKKRIECKLKDVVKKTQDGLRYEAAAGKGVVAKVTVPSM